MKRLLLLTLLLAAQAAQAETWYVLGYWFMSDAPAGLYCRRFDRPLPTIASTLATKIPNARGAVIGAPMADPNAQLLRVTYPLGRKLPDRAFSFLAYAKEQNCQETMDTLVSQSDSLAMFKAHDAPPAQK